MKLRIITLFLFFAFAMNAQVTFDEEITITDFEAKEILMPPSPLAIKPIFVGGYDIVQTAPTYGNPAGRAIAKEWNDFIGWTPDESGASLGWASVNHETIYRDDRIGDGGGMTVFRLKKAADGSIEVMDQELEDGRKGKYFSVDFVNTVGETGMNCAGISAPNGRIWTAEEWWRSDNSKIWNGNVSTKPTLPIAVASDGEAVKEGQGVRDTAMFTINAPEFEALGINGKSVPKFQNFNYMVEIDPKQAKAVRKQYNWGRAGWEGGAITKDGKYVYLGDDATPAPLVRAVATTPWDFTDVKVEVFKEDNTAGERWIEIPRNADNVFEDIRKEAFKVGATMFIRNEWVAIDQETGIVYWTETGRASSSSGPGKVFNAVIADYPDVKPYSAHDAWAKSYGVESSLDENYQDHYGRVNYYDPAKDEIGVVIQGGPYFAESPSAEAYPAKHLSNPDGLNVINIKGKKYLMICEDLNQSSFGSVPAGISNKLCELFILPIESRNAKAEDLIRITAVAKGAEITGAIQISSDAILFNSQHPSTENPFPYNHSITMLVTGFDNVATSVEGSGKLSQEGLTIYPNPTTRTVHLSKKQDFAIYDINGKRLKVFRDTNEADVDGLSTGTYFIITQDKKSYKLIIQ